MAVFKTPRCTTAERLMFKLDPSEIVFDTDEQKFYGGDGATMGGFLIGGGQLKDAGFVVQYIEVSEQLLTAGRVKLVQLPLNPESTTLVMQGGLDQRNGVDFRIEDDYLVWDGLALDGFLDTEDVFIVEYLVWDGLSINTQQIILSEQDVQNKQVTLQASVKNPSAVRLTIDGGLHQVNGVDFMVFDNKLSWDGFGLDDFLETDDILIVQY